MSQEIEAADGERAVGIKCLAPGCGDVARTLREHSRHLADADHPDHGMVTVDLPARW